MTNHKKISTLGVIIISFAIGFSILAMFDDTFNRTENDLNYMAMSKHKDENPIIFSYITSWSNELPDPFSITHLSYAFATIDNNYKSLTIKNEDRFRDIVNLKNVNPYLKVLLAIGGWGAGNFSEMASTEETRKAFIHNAMNIVREYKIDGLDIDWEYPGSSAAKISSSHNDKSNFNKLIKQLRDSLGNSKLLSFASPAYGNYFEYDFLVPYVDFVNLMTYDMSKPPYHHSPLNHSDLTGNKTVKDVVADHYRRGVPGNKMLLGIPFYGRGDEQVYKKFEDFRYIHKKNNTEIKYDSIACVPYIADKKSGKMLISYDDATSIATKCRLVRNCGIKGVMIWHYSGDTKDHYLLKQINSSLK